MADPWTCPFFVGRQKIKPDPTEDQACGRGEQNPIHLNVLVKSNRPDFQHGHVVDTMQKLIHGR